MSWLAEWALFAGVMAVGQFSPGPDMILLTRTALKEGLREGWLVVVGIVMGLALHAALAIGGVSVLLTQGGWWEKGLSVAAAAYLSWLGWQMISVFFMAYYGAIRIEEPARKGSFFQQGLLCNVLNPKVVIFFAGLTTVFLREERGFWWPLLLWGTIVGEGLVLWGLWVVFLQNAKVRGVYRAHGKWADLVFGLGLFLLAGLLLWRAF
ncbi:LysE family translocator [Roseibacillus ishigakijimensis]|nr:LysE family translocator [Roseibacillus ishigakijimensis]